MYEWQRPFKYVFTVRLSWCLIWYGWDVSVYILRVFEWDAKSGYGQVRIIRMSGPLIWTVFACILSARLQLLVATRPEKWRSPQSWRQVFHSQFHLIMEDHINLFDSNFLVVSSAINFSGKFSIDCTNNSSF